MTAAMFKRWHGDNCRELKEMSIGALKKQTSTIEAKGITFKNDNLAEASAEENFLREVEDLVEEHDVSYMDAVVAWCERRGLDVEYAGSLIRKRRAETTTIRNAIHKEADALNLLKRNDAKEDDEQQHAPIRGTADLIGIRPTTPWRNKTKEKVNDDE
jgi:late-transcription coactivator